MPSRIVPFAVLASCAAVARPSLASLVHWSVPATSEEQFLPDRDPVHAERGGVVRIVAAQDEYEPGSFVVKSDADLGKVQLSLGAFTNAQGAALAPESLDLKVVKVWYQNRNGWFSYFGDTGFKLVPELLLNDEDLVRVDTAKQANYAKLTDAEGRPVGERWINPPRQMDKRSADWRTGINSVFQPMRPDFKDAPSLRPVALGRDVRKQFFLTVHVPVGTKPGVYRGEVRLAAAADGRRVGSVPVEVKVLDFVLPRPKTRLDPDRDFIVTAMQYLTIDTPRELNGGDFELAKKQFRAVLENQRRHGVQVYWLSNAANPKQGAENDFYIRTMQEVGMRTDLLIGGAAYPSNSITWKGGVDRGATYSNMVEDAKAQAAYYDRALGHHNVYIWHGDEPSASWVVKERPLVDAFHEGGFKFVLASNRTLFYKGGHLWDATTVSSSPNDPTSPRLWSQISGAPLVGWYGHMHVGPENPAQNRRQYGLAAYLSGYTALMNYAFHLGPWNDDSTTYKPMVNAYGISGGLVDTLQWEGFREGVDDIRYASLLAILARRAAESSDAKTRRAGKRAQLYLATVTPGSDDYFGTGADPLDTVRLEMIGYIEDLRARLGAAADDVEKPIVVRKFAGEHENESFEGQTDSLFGFQGCSRFGDWAKMRRDAERRLANKRERPGSVKSDETFKSMLQAFVMTGAPEKAVALCREERKWEWLADVLEGKKPAWSADPKKATEEMDVAGSFLLLLNDEKRVRELVAAKAALVRPRERKTYPVRYSSRALAGLGDWENATVVAEAQKLDRKFGGNLDFLVTDITSASRGAGIGTDASTNAFEHATLRILCDRRGLHFRFDERNPRAAEIEATVPADASYECYLAPGPDKPYVSFVADQASGRLDLFNTTYDTHGLRAVPSKGLHAARTEVKFGDGVITTYAFIPWESYASLVPHDGDEWEFEVVFWSKRGGYGWNGTESIHGRSTWGRVKFALTDEERAAIVLRQLYAAKKSYGREKVTWHSGEGVIDHWLDADLGDPAFAEACVKPLVAKLDKLADELSPTRAFKPEEVFRLEREALTPWRDIRFILADLRRDWLRDRLMKE